MVFEFADEVFDHLLQGISDLQSPLGFGAIVVDPQRSQLPQEFHDYGVGLKGEPGSRNSILDDFNKLAR
jgi:hypothetical protein